MTSVTPPRAARPGVRCEKVDAGGVPAGVVRSRRGGSASGVLLYFHGGGYVIGSIDSHRATRSRASRRPRRCGPWSSTTASPRSTRSPRSSTTPARPHDWLLATGVVPGRNRGGRRVGGRFGLTLSLLLALRDAREPLPAAAVCMSPWVDLEATGATMRENARYDYVTTEVLRLYASWFAPRDRPEPARLGARTPTSRACLRCSSWREGPRLSSTTRGGSRTARRRTASASRSRSSPT